MSTKADDIQIDENGDDVILNGDYLVEDCSQTNFELLIVIEKGENKLAPGSCVGVANWLLDDGTGEDLKKEIASEIEDDGARIDALSAKSIESITVKGSYGV